MVFDIWLSKYDSQFTLDTKPWQLVLQEGAYKACSVCLP